jgi:VanZ family protein
MAALAVSLFGVFDEFHQHFREGRTVSLGDWLADTIGGIAASVAWLWAWSQGLRAGRQPKQD